MSERSKVPDSKSGIRSKDVSGVRIPLSPPDKKGIFRTHGLQIILDTWVTDLEQKDLSLAQNICP